MSKDIAAVWRETFANWPAQFRRKGVIIPSFGEPTPFVDFVMTPDVLVLERPTPDTVGARRLAIPFAMIEALKYTEPLKTEHFLGAGFVAGAQQDSKRRGGPSAQATAPPQAPVASSEGPRPAQGAAGV